ncbi:MAG TPA: hypothetical protein VLQ48_15390 [Chloroflexia bacterium]|nr:hypothetical protein [Chloroflexia bacterium]
MILHFKDTNLPNNQSSEVAQDTSDESDEIIGDEDRNLDMLMKHAVRSTNWLEHDPKQVWQRLSQRVRGPFGNIAIEEPANLGSSEMPFPEQYERVDATDTRPDARSHSLYRLANEAYTLR